MTIHTQTMPPPPSPGPGTGTAGPGKVVEVLVSGTVVVVVDGVGTVVVEPREVAVAGTVVVVVGCAGTTDHCAYSVTAREGIWNVAPPA